MAIDTGSTSPNGSKINSKCQPYVDVYQITPGTDDRYWQVVSD